jgi:hypothetical protein
MINWNQCTGELLSWTEGPARLLVKHAKVAVKKLMLDVEGRPDLLA